MRITHFERISLLYIGQIVEYLQTFSKQCVLEDPTTRKQNIGNVPKLAAMSVIIICYNLVHRPHSH